MRQDVHSTSLQQGLGETFKFANLKVYFQKENLYIFVYQIKFSFITQVLLMIWMLITFTKCWLCEESIQNILLLRCSLPLIRIVAYIYVIKKKTLSCLNS